MAITVTGEELLQVRELILKGAHGRARSRIREWHVAGIRRELRAQAASCAWPADLPLAALRILRPVVRPSRKLARPASAAEQAEYAASLIRLGCYREADELLAGIDAEEEPNVHMFRTLVAFRRWEWASARPWLESYLRWATRPGGGALRDRHGEVVGRVRLGASLIHGERDYAAGRKALKPAADQDEIQDFKLDALQLTAQAWILEGKPERGREILERIGSGLEPRGRSALHLTIRQWLVIASRLEGKTGAAEFDREMREISVLRGKARMWEFARLSLYYLARFGEAKAGEARELPHLLYFGTPHPAARARFREDFGLVPPAEYVWGRRGRGGSLRVHVGDGKVEGAARGFKPGQLPHRIFASLSSDLIAPVSTGEMYREVFEGEYFNPDSSFDRIHQGLKRLRRLLEAQRIPLGIAEVKGEYRLEPGPGCELVIKDPDAPGAALPPRLAALRAKLERRFGDRWFRAGAAADAAGLSLRSFQRIAPEAVASGLLSREGAGKATRYRLRGE